MSYDRSNTFTGYFDFLNATFASAEIAVISMNETRLRKLTTDGDKGL